MHTTENATTVVLGASTASVPSGPIAATVALADPQGLHLRGLFALRMPKLATTVHRTRALRTAATIVATGAAHTVDLPNIARSAARFCRIPASATRHTWVRSVRIILPLVPEILRHRRPQDPQGLHLRGLFALRMPTLATTVHRTRVLRTAATIVATTVAHTVDLPNIARSAARFCRIPASATRHTWVRSARIILPLVPEILRHRRPLRHLRRHLRVPTRATSESKARGGTMAYTRGSI